MQPILTDAQIAALSPEDQLSYYKNIAADAQAALQAEQSAHQATKVQATEEIGAMSAQLATTVKAAELGYRTASSGGRNYRVIGKKFLIDGKEVTVDDLLKDQGAVDALVAKGSGVFVELAAN